VHKVDKQRISYEKFLILVQEYHFVVKILALRSIITISFEMKVPAWSEILIWLGFPSPKFTSSMSKVTKLSIFALSCLIEVLTELCLEVD
jgi:hypothetical protein